jgi:hypothetical protein
MSDKSGTEAPNGSKPKRRRHPWRNSAERRWGARNILWIQGEGPWALVSTCPPKHSISLWTSRWRAEREKAILRDHCGHHCQGAAYHQIHSLGTGRRTPRRSAHPRATEPRR